MPDRLLGLGAPRMGQGVALMPGSFIDREARRPGWAAPAFCLAPP